MLTNAGASEPMTEDAALYLDEHGLGPVEHTVRLSGMLPADGAGPLPTELCLGPDGAWVIAAGGRFVGRAVDAGDPAQVRYELGRLRDRLRVGEATLSVPTGKASRVRELLAIGRLRRAGYRAARLALPKDRYVESVDEPAEWLVSALLNGTDPLIALLSVHDPRREKSALGPEVQRTGYFVLSAERVHFAWLSELGDLDLRELSVGELTIASREEGPPHVVAPNLDLPIPEKKVALFSELFELISLEPSTRLYEAARRLWLGREKNAAATERSTALLGAAAERGHAQAALALALIVGEREGPGALKTRLYPALKAFRARELPENAAAQVFERWRISPRIGQTAVTLLSGFGAEAEPWTIVLHRAVREQLTEGDAARADLELAEHELSAGDPARARVLAERRLSLLSPDEDALLAPDGVSATRRDAVRLYDILHREGERRGQPDVDALAALARLEPTNLERFRVLANTSSVDERTARLIERARDALRALAPGGLEAAEGAEGRANERPRPIGHAKLDEHLRHPLARGGGRIATRLSELVAKTPEPDLGFLRDFCEELSPERYPDAARALHRAAGLLGLSPLRTYVSHGARSIGMRAFGAREPFVLVGQSHLAERGPASLRGAELDFALGAELSHLAFGHQRVTVSEVWTGAAGKTRDALIALGVVLPLVGEIASARTQRLISKLTPENLARAAEGALKLEEWFGSGKTQDPALGQRNEELIAAHRIVQLSADRAGLINAGSLGPALRAMLVLRTEYHAILEASSTHGLLGALANVPSSAAHADLRIRVRALLAFYLSPDYDALAFTPPLEQSEAVSAAC